MVACCYLYNDRSWTLCVKWTTAYIFKCPNVKACQNECNSSRDKSNKHLYVFHDKYEQYTELFETTLSNTVLLTRINNLIHPLFSRMKNSLVALLLIIAVLASGVVGYTLATSGTALQQQPLPKIRQPLPSSSHG